MMYHTFIYASQFSYRVTVPGPMRPGYPCGYLWEIEDRKSQRTAWMRGLRNNIKALPRKKRLGKAAV